MEKPVLITDINGENAQKIAEVLENISKMLRGDPTAGVYSMYVDSPGIEENR